jgi:cephalosporin hydroxylase
MIEPEGPLAIDRDQPPLTSEETEIVLRFQDLYYQRWRHGADTINLSWHGYMTLKCPLDLWIYQELIVRTRPDFIIETGTYYGGSALYLAAVFDRLGHGEVISIDLAPQDALPQHPRVTYLRGSSTDPTIVEHVRSLVGARPAMVVLDSDHSQRHVYDEIMTYKEFVHPGSYLVVEDTNINGHPTQPDFGPGPMEAVQQFLQSNDEFEIDRRCERFLMTLNPGGYLKRRP